LSGTLIQNQLHAPIPDILAPVHGVGISPSTLINTQTTGEKPIILPESGILTLIVRSERWSGAVVGKWSFDCKWKEVNDQRSNVCRRWESAANLGKSTGIKSYLFAATLKQKVMDLLAPHKVQIHLRIINPPPL
jgi:hypothetical protein